MHSRSYQNLKSTITGRFETPRVELREHKGAPLVAYSGVVLASKLIEKLMVAARIDDAVRVLQRHKPYWESDHVLTLVYNLLSGGETLSDIQRLRQDKGFARLVNSDQVPDPTTVGDFLVRFDDSSLGRLRGTLEAVQDTAFGWLPRRRREVATMDWDSSIHEVYGQKKQGADFAYDHTWCYNVLYATLAETGDVLYQDLREGNTSSSVGTKEVLPATIRRLQQHFQAVRFRADSAFYDQEIVSICDEADVEFFIVAKQQAPLMQSILQIPEDAWKSLYRKHKQPRSGAAKRKKRPNLQRRITVRRKPDSWFKARTQVASIDFQPPTWKSPYRFVITRTEVVDKDGAQLLLDDGLCKYAYQVVVTNSGRSDSAVMRVAHARGNQENLIKDFKYGLGLSHVPTGFLMANKAYFVIASLAWNLKTWMLNLICKLDGAVVRFKRFLYQWIYHAGLLVRTARNTIRLKMASGDYQQRFAAALLRLAKL